MAQPVKRLVMVVPLRSWVSYFICALLLHEATHLLVYLLNPQVEIVGIVFLGIAWRWDIQQITLVPALGGITHFGVGKDSFLDILALLLPILTVGVFYRKSQHPSILIMLLIPIHDYGALLSYVL